MRPTRLFLLFLLFSFPSGALGLSPYDPAIDWSEFLFGPTNMNAFVGCGGLSAGISASGEITVLKYPTPGYFDQMNYLTLSRTLPRMGALPNMGCFIGLAEWDTATSSVSWLRDPPWTRTQHYADDTSNILVTHHQNRTLSLVVKTSDLVSPSDAVLIRHVRIEGDVPSKNTEPFRLIFFENLNPCTEKIPYLPIRDWLLDPMNDYGLVYSSDRGALLHFRPGPGAPSWQTLVPLLTASPSEVDRFVGELGRTYPEGVYLAIGSDRRPEGHQCGREDLFFPLGQWPQDAYRDALDGILSNRSVAPGLASGALSFPLDLSTGFDELTLFITAAPSALNALDLLDEVREKGYHFYRSASVQWWTERFRNVSLPATPDPELKRVCKRALVSLLSACDRQTGSLVASIAAQPPYALDWPRDGAFMNHALDRAGYKQMVTRRNLWLSSLFQIETGLVDMCFYSDGVPGGPLPYEIDNLSLAIWSLWDHAEFLTDSRERRTYLEEVYPAIKAGANFLVRCRDPETGLQCPTMEGDRPWLSQGLCGAASARMGLEAAYRAGEERGEDPGLLNTWKARSEELRQAILDNFWDDEHQWFGDSPITCYLFWPYPLLSLSDPRMQSQAAVILDWCLDNLHKETTGGGYEPLALWMLSEQVDGLGAWARDAIEEAITIFSHEVRTPGTLHFGEAYVTTDLNGDGILEFEAHAAQPQIPIASMVYLTAMALYGPERASTQDITESGSAGSCGACSLQTGKSNGMESFAEMLILLLCVGVFLLRTHRTSIGKGVTEKKPIVRTTTSFKLDDNNALSFFRLLNNE